jgi:anti-repressor protein
MTNIFLHTTSIIPLFQKICRIKEPLFCAKDVATALGYSDTADAIQRYCKSGKKVFCPHKNGMGGTNMVYIPEKDVYRLIMRSNLPNAEQFQDWVCDEVLPSIRKHGGYLTPDKIEEVLSNPDTIIRLATQLKNEP